MQFPNTAQIEGELAQAKVAIDNAMEAVANGNAALANQSIVLAKGWLARADFAMIQGMIVKS